MTASNYPNVLPITLVYEGGKVNDPHDPGGRTNQGVTQRVYDAYRKRNGLPTRTVYSLEATERDAIYEREYWRPSGAVNCANGLDLQVFDYSVNSGVSRGKSTLAKVAGQPTVDAIQSYADYRMGFLHGLGTFARYGKGWTTRVAGVEAKGLRMAHGLDAVAAKETLQKAGAVQRSKAITKRKAAITGGPVALASTTAANHAAGGGNHWIIGITIAVIVIGCVVAAIAASRHDARSTALLAEAGK